MGWIEAIINRKRAVANSALAGLPRRPKLFEQRIIRKILVT